MSILFIVSLWKPVEEQVITSKKMIASNGIWWKLMLKVFEKYPENETQSKNSISKQTEMRKRVIILSVIALIASACGQSGQKQSVTTNNESVIEQSNTDNEINENIESDAIILIENDEENFKMFLEKFGTDSLFQISRIVFPLKLHDYAWDNDGNMIPINDDYGNFLKDSVITHTINLETHLFIGGFAANSYPIEIYGYERPTESDIEAFMEENEYYAEIMVKSVMRISEDEYFVHCFAVEACGRTGYHFKKNDKGQWFLVEIDAKSL
jgi:hypothetical protein